MRARRDRHKERNRIYRAAFAVVGFLVLWVILIIIGTFIRGPGWIWFWPGQEWDAHAVVSASNIDLPEFFDELLAH